MANKIVQVNTTQITAPAPSTLQQTGAIVSQGGTTAAPGTLTLLTGKADLTPVLRGALALSGLTWSGGVVTATTAAPHGLTVSDTLPAVIAGVTPSGYNGGYTITVTGASTFTYPHAGSLGTPASVAGTYTLEDVAELFAQVNTFFNQGSRLSVYALELGPGNAADGVTALAAYIAANPGVFYGYLVPRYWADDATYRAFVANFEALDAETYFFTTLTAGNYASYTPLMKSVFGLVEAPGIPSTEFTCAWPFWVVLSQSPSPSNKVPQMAFTFGFGVTPYPTAGNQAFLAILKAAHVNYCGTGAEGGISTACLFWGTTMDGRDMLKWWYGIDWSQINSELVLANEVINGSNNKINPLYFNQDGINRLQAREASLMGQGVASGIVLGQVVLTELTQQAFVDNVENGVYAGLTAVNAVPFVQYTQANPNDYAAETYSGLSVALVPQLGFKQIIINLSVSDFVAG